VIENLRQIWASTEDPGQNPSERPEVARYCLVVMGVFTFMALVQFSSASEQIGWACAVAATAAAITAYVARVSSRTFLAANLLVLICFVFACAVVVTTQSTAVAALFFTSLVPVVALQVVGIRAAFGWFLTCLLLLAGVALQWFTGIVDPIELGPTATGASSIRAAIIFLIFTFMILASSDITRKAAQRREKLVDDERKRLDHALAEESARYRALVENSRDVIIEIDQPGNVTYASQNRAEVLGVTNLVGSTLSDRIWPSDREEQSALFAQMFTGDEMLSSVPVRYVGDDDVWRWIETTGRRYDSLDGNHRVVIRLRDVTAELDLLRKLQQTQKLQAVGQLAAGVAHDFNNLLTVIMGYADDITQATNSPADAANEILRNAKRGAALTRQLLAFSRESAYTPRVINLSDTVKNVSGMLKRLIGEQTLVQLDLADDLPNVEADPQLLEQAIINLVVNARDASLTGAIVKIRTGLVADGGAVFVEVADSGTGMSPDIAERAFDPFFTTKDIGSGTGLGLAMVHGAVEQMGGRTKLETTEGEGTSVMIQLPSTALPVKTSGHEAQEIEDASVGGTILVVENEDSIRKLVSVNLAAAGFTVLEAEDGEAALAIANKLNHPIDLVVSDVIMPKMSGPTMVTHLRVIHPNAKVLFISGHPKTHLDDIPSEKYDLLQKPFRGDELISRVRALLTGADGF
jgi:two-component system cell cycle sensor histidine kinase/response regulator CckA